jgi:hypothetical protein
LNRRIYLLLSPVICSGLACGVVRLDAGSVGDGGRPDARSEIEGTLWSGVPSNTFDLPCTLAAPDGFGGVWEGEFDSYDLPSGSRALRLQIDGAYEESDGLCGKVVFGKGEPPPMATDPTAPPPGAPWPLDSQSRLRVGRVPVEGFVYEFANVGTDPYAPDGGGALFAPAAVHGQRAQFAITFLQSYKSWCNLQPAYELAPGTQDPQHTLTGTSPRYGCLPPDVQSGMEGGLVCPGFVGSRLHGVSCVQATYCSGSVCDCLPGLGPTSGGCTVLPPALGLGTSNFDLTLSSDTLSGNIILIDGVESVHFTRVK